MSMPDTKTIIQMLRTLHESPEIAKGEAKLYVSYAMEALGDMQKTLRSLPQTFDGVPMVPHMKVWHRDPLQKTSFTSRVVSESRVAIVDKLDSCNAHEFYSTEDAARKACSS